MASLVAVLACHVIWADFVHDWIFLFAGGHNGRCRPGCLFGRSHRRRRLHFRRRFALRLGVVVLVQSPMDFVVVAGN